VSELAKPETHREIVIGPLNDATPCGSGSTSLLKILTTTNILPKINVACNIEIFLSVAGY
jgi:hypothetical protein